MKFINEAESLYLLIKMSVTQSSKSKVKFKSESNPSIYFYIDL